MIIKRRSSTVTTVRLFAILEADGGWLDRKTLAQRFDGRDVLTPHQIAALNRLVDWEMVEVDVRTGPQHQPYYFYRYLRRR